MAKDKINWEKQYIKLQKYANELGFAVKFHDYKKTNKEEDIIDYDKKEILVSTYHATETSIYCLLHELGHAALFKSHNKYRKNYSNIFGRFSSNSLTYKINVLHEELDAWREGYNIALKVKIPVNRKKYEITKARCIRSYAEWALGYYSTKSNTQNKLG